MFPLIFIIIYLHSHAWPIQSSPSLDCSFRGKGGTYNDPSWDLNWECSCFEVIVLTTILSYFIPLCLCQDIFPQGTSDLFFSWWLICSYLVSVFRDSPWTPDSWCWDRRESGVHWMFVTAVLYKIPADTAALRFPKTVLFLDLTHSGASEIRHNRYGSNLTQNSFVEQFQHLCNNIKFKKKSAFMFGPGWFLLLSNIQQTLPGYVPEEPSKTRHVFMWHDHKSVWKHKTVWKMETYLDYYGTACLVCASLLLSYKLFKVKSTVQSVSSNIT